MEKLRAMYIEVEVTSMMKKRYHDYIEDENGNMNYRENDNITFQAFVHNW